MRPAALAITLPGAVALSSRQLLAGLRWLVVGAALVLEVRDGPSDHLSLAAVGVMGVLLLQQTGAFWLARREITGNLATALLVGDAALALVATAICPQPSNLFLLYPLILVEAVLTFAPSATYLFTLALAILYLGAQMINARQHLAAWTANELALALLEGMLFLIVTGVALNVVGAWQAGRKQIDQLALLDELSLLLADHQQLDDVLARLVDLVPPALHVQACAIAIDEPGSGRRIWANLGADTSALIDEALLARETTIAARERRSAGILRFPLRDAPYAALYTAPLTIEDAVVGVLSVARVTPEVFDAQDRRLCDSLARHASQALRNARLYRLEAAAAAQSRDLERFKSDMLASVSHEFRLPLASMRLAAETLLAQHADLPAVAPEIRLLHNITRSAQRLDGFVQDILDLARLEARQLELNPRLCDLVELTRSVVAQLDAQCATKGQRLIFTSALTTCQAQVDARRLEQVVSNLITNAYHYAPEDTEIAVTLAPAELVHAEGPCGPEPVGTAALIGVRDSGPGIPPEERERIFERFQRGAAGQRRSAGAGLGLHIARSIAELHGGCLWVEGNAAGGSTFWLQLPLAHATPYTDPNIPVALPALTYEEHGVAPP